MEVHRQQAIRSKRWSTGLFVFSEVLFLAASVCLAMSLGSQEGARLSLVFGSHACDSHLSSQIQGSRMEYS